MNLLDESIQRMADDLAAAIAALPIAAQVAALNSVRSKLHQVGPFAGEPVDCVQWLPSRSFAANDYNPNSVAPPEMRLLKLSIAKDGYTQPIVAHRTGHGEAVEIVDGFHRFRVGSEDARTVAKLHGYLPAAIVNTQRGERRDRMAATIRHNRARGVHGVRPMTEIVASLIEAGWNDEEVAKELGMDADEVLRFKHVKGLPALFKDGGFSKAWE